MGGQERFCKGGGVPERARGLVKGVGRNQGCNGGHGDSVDGGGKGRAREKAIMARLCNQENRACRAAEVVKRRGGAGKGKGNGLGVGQGQRLQLGHTVRVWLSTTAAGDVDWRSDRGAGEWAVATQRGHQCCQQRGFFRARGWRAWWAMGRG
eukprot:scaffold79_cov145-Amphora_coffeaeformis.AAC.9